MGMGVSHLTSVRSHGKKLFFFFCAVKTARSTTAAASIIARDIIIFFHSIVDFIERPTLRRTFPNRSLSQGCYPGKENNKGAGKN